MSQSAISASAPREPGTIVIAGGLFSLYAAALVFLSMVWPRYGLLDLGVRIPPYTLLSISAWLLIPVLLAARSDYRTRLGDAVAEKKWLIAAFVAWMAWRLLSSALGDSPTDSMTETIKEIAFLWPLVPLTLILMTYQAGLVAFLRVVIAASVILISIGFIEQATGQTIAAMLGLGITGDDLYAAEVLRPNFRAGELRSKAVFYHPIVFAQYLGWAAPFLFMSLREKVGVLYRACALLSLMCLPAAIASTGTRSGLICALVAAILYFAVRMMQRVRMSFGATMIVLSVATVFGCVLFGLSQEILGDLITGRDSTEFGSTQVRLRMLEIGLSNIQHSPIYGYGDGRAAYYAGNFTGGTAFYTIDNFYLSTLLNNGWVGLLLLVLSWGALPIAALRFAVVLRRPVDAAVFAAVASLLLSFSIVSITDGISFLLVSLAVAGVQPSSRTVPSTLGVSPKSLQQQASAA